MDEYSREHKKQHKKEKNKKKKYSSSESEDEWVEKKLDQPLEVQSSKRDDWMSLETDFTSFSSTKENKAIKKGPEPKPCPLEKLGQSSRELNPYWRDGGDGLPPEKKSRSTEYGRKEKSSRNSLEKSSKRNKQSGSDNKSVYSKTKYSGKKEMDKSVDEQNKTNRQQKNEQNSYFNRKDSSYRQESTKEGHKSKFDYIDQETKRERNYSSNRSFRKPKFDDDNDFDRNSERQKQTEHNKSRDVRSSSKKGWQKRSRPEPTENDSEPEYQDRSSIDVLPNNEITLTEEPQKILSLDELNKLSARMIKAEIMGNTKLAEELKLQLEQAKKKSSCEDTDSEDEKVREILILTETDSKGFTRPLQSIREEQLNTKRKIETHEGNKRVRYFADDDSQSLQDMYEKERFGSSREQNATFMKLMGKELSENNEDAFEETASFATTSRQDRKNWNDAVKDNVKKEKALDSCYWCLDSKYMNQDVIVAIRNKVQLCVPSSYSLTDGHCIILPRDHISCATKLDEDVWEDIMSLRKNLVKVFKAEGDDVIFFECASNLDKFPHMQLHCVPVPKEAGDVAPIYFKKAIMECEMEWSSNKKVVDLKGKNVRKAIPKGLPYFAVDFGMQPGFAHVIEDRKLFPNNFAQEVIGGMLDIDHSKWRKYHRDSEENIQKKATYLKNLIQKHL